jgi:hypothetical protein
MFVISRRHGTALDDSTTDGALSPGSVAPIGHYATGPPAVRMLLETLAAASAWHSSSSAQLGDRALISDVDWRPGEAPYIGARSSAASSSVERRARARHRLPGGEWHVTQTATGVLDMAP